MKTEWDYTTLPIASAEKGNWFCNVRAGVAHLKLLAARSMLVMHAELNGAMCAYGIKRAKALPNVLWHEARALEEITPRKVYKDLHIVKNFTRSFNWTPLISFFKMAKNIFIEYRHSLNLFKKETK